MNREKLMAGRMRYIQTAIKRLRSEISTGELLSNPQILPLFHAIERHLREMEAAYAWQSARKPDF
jgi:hypothetical protein